MKFAIAAVLVIALSPAYAQQVSCVRATCPATSARMFQGKRNKQLLKIFPRPTGLHPHKLLAPFELSPAVRQFFGFSRPAENIALPGFTGSGVSTNASVPQPSLPAIGGTNTFSVAGPQFSGAHGGLSFHP